MLVRLDDLRGVNNLTEKQAIVEVKRGRSTVRRIQKFGQEVAIDMGVLGYGTVIDMANMFEPGFMRRARRQRRHLKKISESEVESEKTALEKKETRDRAVRLRDG